MPVSTLWVNISRKLLTKYRTPFLAIGCARIPGCRVIPGMIEGMMKAVVHSSVRDPMVSDVIWF